MISTGLASHLTVLIFLHLVTSCYKQWDKLPLDGPLGTRADFSWRQKFYNSQNNPLELDRLIFFSHDYGLLHVPFPTGNLIKILLRLL